MCIRGLREVGGLLHTAAGGEVTEVDLRGVVVVQVGVVVCE